MAQKAIFVTGANGGIGSALVSALSERGWTVYAGVRAKRTAPDGPGVVPVTIDVTDPASVTAAAEEVASAQGGRGLRAVVNNAGVIVQGPVELVPEAEWQRQFDVNVHGPVRVMRAFLPLLRAGAGRVVNVSAPSAQVAFPFLGALSASKAALESLSAAARVELAAWGIPVIAVEPGAMATQIFAKAEAAASSALADAPPDRVALYGPMLESAGRTMSNMRLGPLDPAIKALLAACESRRPKPRYVARDARAAAFLAHLPARLRDRVLARATGVSGAAAPKSSQTAAVRRAS